MPRPPPPTALASGRLVDVVTPSAGESVTEGTILEWRVKVGEEIRESDTIVDISTDKVDVELPAPASGTVAELLAAEGDTVTVGQVIARIAVGEPAKASNAGSDGSGSGPAAGADGSLDTPDGVRASPVAARAAAAEGVDLSRLSGSGPDGRITKSDVLSAASPGGGVADRAGANGLAGPRRSAQR